ncbi:MAG: NAD(P)H-dependent oxidoreductase [Myxococcota bacterium]|nr:NAD(P)H-dependent oxidoreductase [Myxococcota bacterium]
MARILILFAHPALQKSRVNRVLIDAVREVDGVTVHDLYEAYPTFDIDVAREQALVMGCDVLVFHHPFFWYSVPSLLKEWLDLVLEHGWAYGHKGTALKGKLLLSAVSTGGREAAYQRDGFNQHTMLDLLAPIAQTARLCGMTYLPPFAVHGTLEMSADAINAHGQDFRRVIQALRDDRIDLDAAQSLLRLNADLASVLKQEKR